MNAVTSRKALPTAETFLSRGQYVVLGVAAVVMLTIGVRFGVTPILKGLTAAITLFYLLFVGLKLVVFFAGTRFTYPDLVVPRDTDPNLPYYTILIPMVGETEAGFVNLLASLKKLQYPTDRLRIMLLLEKHKPEDIAMVNRHTLPDHFRVIVTPFTGPKTKPKACDWAMTLIHRVDEYAKFRTGRLVIFDFEDRPKSKSLLVAVASLNYENSLDERVACVQGRLQFWTTKTGKATAFYWAEYIVHFKWTLPGLAKLGLIPPLGGTSNHFYAEALFKVAEAYEDVKLKYQGETIIILNVWDGWNVTEDADLAGRLARLGYRIKMANTVTFEESPGALKKARDQRSRWTKGFMQTFITWTQQPLANAKAMGSVNYLVYLLFVGGTPLSFIINPIVWGMTLLYVVSRWASWTSVTLYLESLYPDPVYYTAMAVAILGNGILLVQKLLAVLAAQEEEQTKHLSPAMQQDMLGLTWRLLLTPLWWAFTCVSAYIAAFEILHPELRFHWAKSDHSHNAALEGAMLGTGSAVSVLPRSLDTTLPAALPVGNGQATQRQIPPVGAHHLVEEPRPRQTERDN